MRADLRNTALNNRILWYDGITAVPADSILTTPLPTEYVDRENDTVREYNKYAPSHKKIQVKNDCSDLPLDWNIPDPYKRLDVEEYVLEIFDTKHRSKYSLDEACCRARRIMRELNDYNKFGLYDVLRAVIYVINTLSSKEVVWGIGRGSSVSSYILYLVEAHDVDSFSYDLDITDFLHS